MSNVVADDLEQVPDARRDSLRETIGLVARLIVGVVLVVAGALKVTHPLDSARAVMAYEIFPWAVSRIIGYALPMVEIILGLLLIAGLFTRAAAVIASLLWLAFIIGIASAWVRGLQIDCGCFGGGGALAAGESPNYFWEEARDIGLLLLSLWLVRWPRTRLSADSAMFG
ncbi:MAG: DoxX family membrane protein [Micrococcales bacterium]|nr:DoxX family membrane protein [Micrococcales bacterium]